MSESQSRIPQLDGLRGIAILLVLVWHYLVVPYNTNAFPLNYLKRLGSITWSGVDLFFVLSGFLLGGILMSNRRAGNYFSTFYRRRFYRILPLYAVWLALFYLLRAGTAGVLLPDPHRWLFAENFSPLWYLTLTQNVPMAFSSFGSNWLGATWSLAVEEQFYLLLPLIIYACAPRRLPVLLGGIILLAPLLRAVSLGILHLPLGDYVLMPCRADALMLGVLCAWALRQPQANEWLRSHQRLLYALLGVFALGTVPMLRYGLGTPLSSALGYLWIAAFYSCLLLIVVTGNGIFSKIVANRFLRHLGTIAYGVYLFHQGINGLLHGFILGRPPTLDDLPGVAVTCIALIFTLLAAHCSWRFFERRFVKIGHQYKYDSPVEAPAVMPTR